MKSVVTPDRVRFVLSSLAHDSMEGRGTGTPGSMRAAKFIAEQFRLAGLTPAGDSGYFQHVPMFTRAVDPKSAITVDGTTLRLGVDFAVAAGRADTRSLDGVQVIYGGVAGDTSAALTADQVRGKLVIFAAAPSTTGRRGGPGAAGGGGARRRWRWTSTRAARAAETILRPMRVAPRARRGGGGGRGPGRGRFQSGGPLAEAAGIATIEGDQLTPRTVWAAKHNTTAFVKDPSAAATPSSPAAANVSLTTHAAEVLLGTSLAAAKSGMLGKTIKSTIAFVEKPALGGNVVGIIEGADPVLKNEVVLVDAHYDHLGIAMPAAGSTDSIYNGADDDASGTTAVIEIARGIKAGAGAEAHAHLRRDHRRRGRTARHRLVHRASGATAQPDDREPRDRDDGSSRLACRRRRQGVAHRLRAVDDGRHARRARHADREGSASGSELFPAQRQHRVRAHGHSRAHAVVVRPASPTTTRPTTKCDSRTSTT